MSLVRGFPPACEPVGKPLRDLVGLATHFQSDGHGRTCRTTDGLVDAGSCGVGGFVDGFAGGSCRLVYGFASLSCALLSCVSS
jgi:hypothetical protein